MADEAEAAHVGRAVASPPVGLAGRGRQDTGPLVIADRLDVHARSAGQIAYLQFLPCSCSHYRF